MKSTLCRIFENNAFKQVDMQWKDFNTKTYINEKSETYIVMFIDGLPKGLQESIVRFCSNELYKTELLTKANKSNLYIIIVSKVDGELTESQLNHIFMIEENNLYYKKFFLWYTESELSSFKELLEDDFSSHNMNKKLVDFEQFVKFKKENLGYALLSRLYIKLAFLTLAEIETLKKALVEYIKESVNKLNENLFDEVVDCFEKNSLIDGSIEIIELTEKDMGEIDKLMEEVDK